MHALKKGNDSRKTRIPQKMKLWLSLDTSRSELDKCLIGDTMGIGEPQNFRGRSTTQCPLFCEGLQAEQCRELSAFSR
jgi:hypothetical protein